MEFSISFGLVGGMLLRIDKKFSGKKMGVPLIIFLQKLGVPPNHQIFFGSGRPGRAPRAAGAEKVGE